VHEPSEDLGSTSQPHGGQGPEKSTHGGDQQRKSVRKRRIEPPVLVIEPETGPAPPRRPAGDASVTRNLEGMVHDLLNKVREAEERLQEKEEAISLLQDQTVTMARKLLLSREGTSKSQAEKPGPSSEKVGLEALDFFTRAFHPDPSFAGGAGSGGTASRATSAEKASEKVSDKAAEKAARPTREPKAGRVRTPAAGAHVGPAIASGRACPACGKHLRKARCLNVQILVCLACRGLFLDPRAVRQLARLLPWMHYVEQFLGSASREAPAPPKPAKGAAQKAGVPKS
jgi:TFIIB-like protein